MRTILLIALACLAALTIAAPPAGAIVAPRDCGNIRVSGKRLQIKADQLSCRTAKRHARRYASTGRRPKGYKCRKFDASVTKRAFSCRRGVREILANRR